MQGTEDIDEAARLHAGRSASYVGAAASVLETPGPSGGRADMPSQATHANARAPSPVHEAASPSSAENLRVGGRYNGDEKPWQQHPPSQAVHQDLQASSPLLPGMPLSKILEKGRHAKPGARAEQDARNRQ